VRGNFRMIGCDPLCRAGIAGHGAPFAATNVVARRRGLAFALAIKQPFAWGCFISDHGARGRPSLPLELREGELNVLYGESCAGRFFSEPAEGRTRGRTRGGTLPDTLVESASFDFPEPSPPCSRTVNEIGAT